MGAADRELSRCARTHLNEASAKAKSPCPHCGQTALDEVLPEDQGVACCPKCGTATVPPPVRSWNERRVRRRPNGCLEVTDIWARYELHQEYVVLLGYTMKRRVMKSGVLPLDKTA